MIRALLLAAVLLAGCAPEWTLQHPDARPAAVFVQYLSVTEAYAHCGSIACFRQQGNICYVIVGASAQLSCDLKHEFAHCAGYGHPGHPGVRFTKDCGP